MKTLLKAGLTMTLCLVAAVAPRPSDALTRPAAAEVTPAGRDAFARHAVTQRDGMSLSDAVESVRRRGNVERIISADTRIMGGREVHYVKVLTKDGKVRTHKFPGRKRN